MKSGTCLVAWAMIAVGSGCKEEMHPPAEEQSAPQPAAAEPSTPKQPAAAETTPAQTAKSEEPKREVTSDGYEIVRAKPNERESANPPEPTSLAWKSQKPDTPDPHGGKFDLKEALKGLPPQGKLQANIRTSLGSLECQLFEDKAPVTVANFVGLARGLRKFWSPKDHGWIGRPYYDGTSFHRVIPEFMIQGGDWAGDGSGNMYFTVPDELHPSLKHDRGGLLCMANRGPNTNEAQFFITEASAPHLDSSYTIFGECSPVDLVKRIARVPQNGPPSNRPLTPVVIEKITIERRAAGAKTAAAKPAEAPAAATKP